MQLEEFYAPFEAKEEMEDGYLYTERFVLNALGIDAWITVSQLNDTAGVNRLIYSEASVSDEIDGLFSMEFYSGKVNYNYILKPLTVIDSYDIIQKSSIKISLDVIDFIVNSHIEKNMLYHSKRYPERLWRYIPGMIRLLPSSEKSGYIIMD